MAQMTTIKTVPHNFVLSSVKNLLKKPEAIVNPGLNKAKRLQPLVWLALLGIGFVVRDSINSIDSIGSIGSIVSIASIGSIGFIGFIGSIGSIE